MSETQSCIETTLPPGYIGERCGQCWEWHTLADGSVMFVTRAECNRSAWRHWTAAVLRGRRIRWSGGRDGVNTTAWIERDGPQVCRYYGVHAGPKYQGALEVSGCGGVFRDVDEAMARFAAMVLATEGMVPR